MNAEQVITAAYLAVSVLSLIVQSAALHRLRRQRAGGGLRRTVACRVACSVLYVAVGLNAIVGHWAVLQTTFAVYVVTQVTWWINSRLDVRRGRPNRRRRWPITITIGREPALEQPARTEAP